MELERLKNKIDYERAGFELVAIASNTNVNDVNNPAVYEWNASSTDLIELVAALHASDSIKRADDKSLTQKELFEYFQGVFNIRLNNIGSNLNKASNRINGKTPYLDKLKLTIENYVQKKEDKLKKRS